MAGPTQPTDVFRGFRASRIPTRGSCSCALLELDGAPRLLDLRLDRLGLVLGGALLDGARGTVHEVLRLLEAEAGDRADDLDHLDLLVAGGGEDDVEGVLLLLGRRAVAGGREDRRGNRDGRGGGDAPL